MATLKYKKIDSKDYKKLPTESGVYLFFNKNYKLLYVGKAINLKKRVASYFLGREQDPPAWPKPLRRGEGPRKQKMVLEVKYIKFITTQSEIEALILESQLIKKFIPPYNISLRDDKQYFFVAITKDVWPIVYLTHQIQKPRTEYIGPFTDGASIKTTLKLLRKSFPYSTIKHKNNRPCSWCHIGLCPVSEGNQKLYLKNLSVIKRFLSGNPSQIIKKLQKEMVILSKKEEFEEAAKLRNQIQKLQNIISHRSVVDTRNKPRVEIIKKIWKQTFGFKFPQRLEAYDISNISGLLSTGSMVVLENGKLNKKEYRKFHVHYDKKPNDVAMLKEVLARRLRHKEWPLPQVILVDGGKGQLGAAKRILAYYKLKIPVLAFAKGERVVFNSSFLRKINLEKLSEQIKNIILLADDEAHRFAISYHKKLRRKEFLK